MRFGVALVSGLAAAVSAQTNSVAADPATASAAACLKKCAIGDVNCQSHCITVPNPNEEQVNDTTKCAAACPQGKGSPEETQKYADCVQGCISKHFYVSSEGTPQATGGSGGSGGVGSSSNTSAAPPSEATATGGAASTTSASSGSGSGSGSQTSSSGADAGASQTQTTGSSQGSQTSKTSSSAAATSTNAAPGMKTFGATGALVGAFAALVAL